MPESILTPGRLIDDLIPVVDEIRQEVHDALGVRTFTVNTVFRQWTGTRLGEGTFTDTPLLLTPDPLVMVDVGGTMQPAGLAEEGNVTLFEVSLTFSEPELYKPTLADNQEFVYRLDDKLGQLVARRYYVPARKPRRQIASQKSPVGWRIDLKRVEDLPV